MSRKLVWLFFVITGISMPALAQSNFEPGRIFLHSGDTVVGEIDNRDWKRNPEVIVFRGDAGRTINYRPIDISGFQIISSENGTHRLFSRSIKLP